MAIPRYTRSAVVLHWLIAIGVVANVALAWTWPYLSTSARPLVDTHKSIGLTVLGLALMRVLWRATHRPPPLPSRYQRWEIGASHATHLLLYALILAMPLSGWIMDSAWAQAAANPLHYFGTFEFPRIGFIERLDPALRETIHARAGAVHGYLAYVLYALFALHIAGALKHQWLDREPELQRMWIKT